MANLTVQAHANTNVSYHSLLHDSQKSTLAPTSRSSSVNLASILREVLEFKQVEGSKKV